MSLSVSGLSSSHTSNQDFGSVGQQFALAAESVGLEDAVTLSGALLDAAAENAASISGAVAASVQNTVNLYA